MKYLQTLVIWAVLLCLILIMVYFLIAPYFKFKSKVTVRRFQRESWAEYKELWKYRTFTELR